VHICLNVFKAGAHPGMRAAAEMKKAAVQQSATGEKGMMGVVLPMYAIGIVLYLLYTLSKVCVVLVLYTILNSIVWY